MTSHSLEVSPESFAICRLAAQAPVPNWAKAGAFLSVTRTAEELSIVCEERHVPADVKHDPGWRCLKLAGPFDLNLTGVLASVLEPLAAAGVSIFALSTFDTDYVLVRNAQLEKTIGALRRAGHRVQTQDPPSRG